MALFDVLKKRANELAVIAEDLNHHRLGARTAPQTGFLASVMQFALLTKPTTTPSHRHTRIAVYTASMKMKHCNPSFKSSPISVDIAVIISERKGPNPKHFCAAFQAWRACVLFPCRICPSCLPDYEHAGTVMTPTELVCRKSTEKPNAQMLMTYNKL
jgi:hypothetical protein